MDTGIRDRNGIVIREGDTVEIPDSDWARGIVVWRRIWMVEMDNELTPLDVSPRPMLWQIENEE